MTDQVLDKTVQDFAFRYHQEQWQQVRHHETQRSTLTLQIVALSIALGGAYFSKIDSANVQYLRAGLAVLIALLGIIGYILVSHTNRAAASHIKRARAARESLVVLEPFASTANDFPKIHRQFLMLHVVIVLAGILLLGMSLSPNFSFERTRVSVRYDCNDVAVHAASRAPLNKALGASLDTVAVHSELRE